MTWKDTLRPFFPHLREIDEQYEAERIESIYAARREAQGLPLPEKEEDIRTTTTQVDEIQWEVRDEANRSWWSIFNEYEYKAKSDKQAQHRWYHWFDPNDTPEERKLIVKLDIVLAFFSLVMYWVKYLDQSNLNNAYVSGMKEDLGMKGNDLVNTQIVYTVGSVVFQIPFMYVIYRYPTHYILPMMDIGWGLFTLATYRANTVAQLQVFRFFVGVFESAFYPTIHYLFGSWYKPHEYARRGGIYYFGQMLGILTAGLLQSAAYQNLHMVNGLEGWRWMFIIDAIITLPIGIIAYWALPGTPKKVFSVFLTDSDIYLARKRLRDANMSMDSEGPQFFNIALWKDILGDWKYYGYVFLNVLSWNTSNGSSGAYLLWIKSLGRFSVPKINQLSTITPALGILHIFTTSLVADLGRSKWGAILYSQSLNFLGNVLLAVWDIPENAKWFAFALQYYGWAASTVNYSWAADGCRHNPQHRAITVVSMNMIGQASTALTSAFVWKTVDQPRFLKGFSFTATATFCMILWASFFLLPMYKREERKHAAENHILVYNSAKGEEPPLPPTLPAVVSDEDDIAFTTSNDSTPRKEIQRVEETVEKR